MCVYIYIGVYVYVYVCGSVFINMLFLTQVLTSLSIFLNSESSSSTSKYSSVDVTEIIPGATIPGAINLPFVLMFTGPVIKHDQLD